MQSRYFLLTLLMGLFYISINIQAQISTDGTVGPASTLSGPNYQIGPEWGRQFGNNLFHSFRDFNIRFGESATFSGPDSVGNIISRVTGGNPSRINGLFRSTIPNADVYFLNPYGILFGEGASLDVQGSFHASTADYLRFADGSEFNARNPEQPLLTVAPIESFGFLTDAPGAITLQDSRLSVPEGETLSLLGSRGLGMDNVRLFANSGQIILDGEIIIGKDTQIDVSGEGGGNIFIRGGQIQFINSLILAETQGNEDGGIIGIQADNLILENPFFFFGFGTSKISTITRGAGNGGDIFIRVADTLLLSNSEILANTMSNSEIINGGDAGNIDIEASQIDLKNGSVVQSATETLGNSGTINIRANDLKLNNQSRISNTTFGKRGISRTGDANTINLNIKGNLTLLDSKIFSDSGTNEFSNAGNAGIIEIKAHQVRLSNDSAIRSSTYGIGESGTIFIKKEEENQSLNIFLNDSKILTNSFGTEGKSGNAGKIEIEASQIMLQNGAVIQSATQTSGNSGTIDITANNLTLTKGAVISNSTFWHGKGGTISIKVNGTLTMSDSNIFNSSKGKTNGGNGGKTEIAASQIVLKEEASIESTTESTGDAGSITIIADNLTILGSVILGNSLNYGGNAGNIVIGVDKIILKDSALIQSGTQTSGNGGTIAILADDLELTDGSRISTSTLGAGEAGTILIKVYGTLTASGVAKDDVDKSSSIVSDSGNKENKDAGNAGQIEIQASQIVLSNNASIRANTYGTGESGFLSITVSDSLNLSNESIIVTNSFGTEGKTGNAGTIDIVAPQVTLDEGAAIQSSTEGFGNSGTIEITANDLTLTKGAVISNSTFGTGNGNSITLNVNGNLTLSGSNIYSTAGNNENPDTGHAGQIILNASQVKLEEGSVKTSAFNAGGGNITITTPKLLYLRDAAITTSVIGGQGDGGNIKIGFIEDENGNTNISDFPIFLVLNGASITAQADKGKGGNILGISDHLFFEANKTRINASSRENIDGQVVFLAQDLNIVEDELVVLPIVPLNADDLLRNLCAGVTRRTLSKFIVIDRNVPPKTPADTKSHYIRRADAPKPVMPEQLF
jgi:filamentous hemagglutinin family protein